MDSDQEKHERRTGYILIEWYNQRHGTLFQFAGRPGNAPDLTYREKRKLGVEVVSAYYDDCEDAKFQWLKARGRPDAAKEWEGKNFEQYLVDDISAKIADKCGKSYGLNCLLAVYAYASLSFADDMETIVNSVRVPAAHAFDGIYLCAEFAPLLDEYFNGYKDEVQGVATLSARHLINSKRCCDLAHSWLRGRCAF
jgi:hypothetical protein